MSGEVEHDGSGAARLGAAGGRGGAEEALMAVAYARVREPARGAAGDAAAGLASG